MQGFDMQDCITKCSAWFCTALSLLLSVCYPYFRSSFRYMGPCNCSCRRFHSRGTIHHSCRDSTCKIASLNAALGSVLLCHHYYLFAILTFAVHSAIWAHATAAVGGSIVVARSTIHAGIRHARLHH